MTEKEKKKLYYKFATIADSDKNLSKNHLSPYDYKELSYVLDTVFNCSSGYTICANVAEWCRKNGLAVESPSGEKIYYIISMR